MYVSLHNHTYFSVLDGLIDPDKLAPRVKEWGMPAIAITDHGNLSGVPDFYNACKKSGVKPILGIEAYVVPNRHEHATFKSPTGKEVRTGYHLILLAKNLKGYQNLIDLIRWVNIFLGKNRHEMLCHVTHTYVQLTEKGAIMVIQMEKIEFRTATSASDHMREREPAIKPKGFRKRQ